MKSLPISNLSVLTIGFFNRESALGNQESLPRHFFPADNFASRMPR